MLPIDVDEAPERVSETELPQLIANAWHRRAELHKDANTDCYRIVNGWGDGIPGLDIDQYGDAIIIRFRERWQQALEVVVATLRELTKPTLVIGRKYKGESKLLFGTPGTPHLVAQELGLRYEIDFLAKANPGLYLDARVARAWVREHSRDRRVLNLFSFTGSLGVAAMAGGARSVSHVDNQKKALGRCRRNYELNGFAIDDRDLVRLNIYQHLRKESARKRRFDAIIVDPPPLSAVVRGNDRTPGERGPVALADAAAHLLNPQGWALFFLHHREPPEELKRQILSRCAGRFQTMWEDVAGPDFPDVDPDRRTHFVAFRRI